MLSDTNALSHAQELLHRANDGSLEARAALIEHSCERLRKLAERMLHRRFSELRRFGSYFNAHRPCCRAPIEHFYHHQTSENIKP